MLWLHIYGDANFMKVSLFTALSCPDAHAGCAAN